MASQVNSQWVCTHCRNACPVRAQCAIYKRTNERRRDQHMQQRTWSVGGGHPAPCHPGAGAGADMGGVATGPTTITAGTVGATVVRMGPGGGEGHSLAHQGILNSGGLQDNSHAGVRHSVRFGHGVAGTEHEDSYTPAHIDRHDGR